MGHGRSSDGIISLVKKRQTRYMKKTHKCGVEVPKTVTKAKELDKRNGNTKWADAISKEMTIIMVAFDILDGRVRDPIVISSSILRWKTLDAMLDVLLEDT